jgi:threonine dehydrogenase-like Zn-dependent dehydrogenase
MWSPGYSYEFFGGDATYCIIPPEVMELGCLIPYNGRAYYEASLAEPMSCCIGAMHACYHTKMGSYVHSMGTREKGTMALLAAAGPMGMGAVDYALHSGRNPALLVVADINKDRLDRAQRMFPAEEAAQLGTRLLFVNISGADNPAVLLRKYAPGGFDDVFAFAPVAQVCELASAVLGRDGCLNFFAGPTDKQFSAKLNYYDVHYNSAHVIGTTGGNTEDLKESLRLSAAGKINPAVMITHVGGLNAAAETTLNLPKIPGGKKLIYTHIDMPLTDISDFASLGKNDPRFTDLAEITEKHRGLWCPEAEEYLLNHWKQD